MFDKIRFKFDSDFNFVIDRIDRMMEGVEPTQFYTVWELKRILMLINEVEKGFNKFERISYKILKKYENC